MLFKEVSELGLMVFFASENSSLLLESELQITKSVIYNSSLESARAPSKGRIMKWVRIPLETSLN
ncbi:hypothetical protein Dtox_4022 [Desulfofarcimen acetoxidans DSM 771]|uniref:Uncharacterized protein n=1 Tax=Desulfofarcimen acetoxidans (strain ATCC 49208 / DSM 771 / KCTC 5769 / VKM B-1644 / 5575) TaxID=485916 RepID=C8VY78_DESAS|nr:hypothetical protein Dtox_4022 [Desulfofarcimen acetoxidans DSM 771]